MRLAVVYLFLATTATILFLNLSSTPQRAHDHHLHLSRRLGHRHASFDPLAAQFGTIIKEGRRGNKEAEQGYNSLSLFDLMYNPFSDVLEDPTDYFSVEGLLNITGRLQVLFPLLDTSPQDGVLSFEEMEAWNVRQAMNRLIFWAMKEMKEHDNDSDKAITLEEYLSDFSDDSLEMNGTTHSEAGRWKEQFINADVDGNGRLNLTEFIDFLHPEESDNEKIQLWLIKEKIRGMDYDKDGKLNFNEFRDQAYEAYRNFYEFRSGEYDIPNTEEKFAELDLNMDKFLTATELRPIFHIFNPGELSYAKHYTKYLINEVDHDRDGKLTLDEMLAYPHVFYSTVLTEGEFENDDDYHDEL